MCYGLLTGLRPSRFEESIRGFLSNKANILDAAILALPMSGAIVNALPKAWPPNVIVENTLQI